MYDSIHIHGHALHDIYMYAASRTPGTQHTCNHSMKIYNYAPVVVSSCARLRLAVTNRKSTVVLNLLLIISWISFSLSPRGTGRFLARVTSQMYRDINFQLVQYIVFWRGLRYHCLSLHAFTE